MIICQSIIRKLYRITGLCLVCFCIASTNAVTAQSQSIGGIINSYALVDSLDLCDNRLYLNSESYGSFNTGDAILIIQNKGSELFKNINTLRFGKVKAFENAGNCEINYVQEAQPGYLKLKNQLRNSYDFGTSWIQVVSIPKYGDATISGVLKPLEWNGRIGGILILSTSGKLSFAADIDATGSGYEGGKSNTELPTVSNCNVDSFYYIKGTPVAAEKGNSYANLGDSSFTGRGKKGSGGGGGQGSASGGGGGGNGGQGGSGGNQSTICGNAINNGGIGGDSIPYSTLGNRLFLGSGGGGGHVVNKVSKNSGGNGGGLVILLANSIEGNGYAIKANGADANECTGAASKCKEGMGGGGSGGSVYIKSTNINSILNVEIKGGKGADVADNYIELFGPGGGGGGGVLMIEGNNLPAQLSVSKSGGINGINIKFNDAHYATRGDDGVILLNTQVIEANTQFQYDTIAVKIHYTDTSCNGLKLQATPVNAADTLFNYLWSFHDGGSLSGQQVTYSYGTSGVYPVTIYGTDTSGCLSKLDTFVTRKDFQLDAGSDLSKCPQKPVQLTLQTNATLYQWSPGIFFSDSTINNPIYQDTVSRFVHARVIFTGGCVLIDSLKIDIIPAPVFSISDDTTVCKNDSALLSATGADLYTWFPPMALSSINQNKTKAAPSQTTTYSVSMYNSTCGDTATLQTTVFIKPAADVKISKSNDITCTETSAILTATGASSVTWLPADQIEPLNRYSVRVKPLSNTTFTALGPDINGCTGKDTTLVLVKITPFTFNMPNAFTPNRDGLNECFGVKFIPPVVSFQMRIYNRYAQLIFETTDYRKCWDGRYRFYDQPAGSYFYIIQAETACGPIVKKDFVQLIR